MVFGFNTDVRSGSAVYHVQSEVRSKEHLLQTQVFVRGQCIGKCATQLPGSSATETSEDAVQELLKSQHRRIVNAVRAGSLDQELAAIGLPSPEAQVELISNAVFDAAPPLDSANAPTLVASSDGLATGPMAIECLNAESVLHDGRIAMLLQVTCDHRPVPNAELTLRLVWGEKPSSYYYDFTGPEGTAEVSMPIDGGALQGRVLVQATSGTTSATRRFRFAAPKA